MPNAVELAREWVAAYPSADSWRNAIAIYRNMQHRDPTALLDILRLAHVHRARCSGDRRLSALRRRGAQRGRTIITRRRRSSTGHCGGQIEPSDPGFGDIRRRCQGKGPATPADSARGEEGARGAGLHPRSATVYYGPAITRRPPNSIAQALAKGADARHRQLRLGEALARSGDKAGATAALNAVGGIASDIAKYLAALRRNQPPDRRRPKSRAASASKPGTRCPVSGWLSGASLAAA